MYLKKLLIVMGLVFACMGEGTSYGSYASLSSKEDPSDASTSGSRARTTTTTTENSEELVDRQQEEQIKNLKNLIAKKERYLRYAKWVDYVFGGCVALTGGIALYCPSGSYGRDLWTKAAAGLFGIDVFVRGCIMCLENSIKAHTAEKAELEA